MKLIERVSWIGLALGLAYCVGEVGSEIIKERILREPTQQYYVLLNQNIHNSNMRSIRRAIAIQDSGNAPY